MRRGRPRHPDILTPRQWQVLELLRQGLTNEQIARRLGLTLDGAKYHVSEIITKLGVSSREQAAAWWAEREARRLGVLAPAAMLLKKATSGAALKAAAGAGAVVVAGAAVLLALALVLDSAREQQVLPNTAGDFGKLAYIQNGDLWVMALPDGKPMRLTTDSQASYPRWSPSGEWLLAGDKVIRSDGGRTRAAPGCVAWSPVNDRLACVTPDYKIRIEDAAGGNVVQLDPTPLVGGVDARSITRLGAYWNPDGSALAYVLDAPLTSPAAAPQPHRYSGLWIVNADGSGARELLNNQGHPEAGQIGVFGWNGDHLLLLFNPFFSASIPNDGLPLYAMPLSGEAPRRLNEVMLPRDEMFGGSTGPSTAVLVTEGGGRETWTRKRIAIVDPGGNSLTYLTSAESAAFSPMWAPDGSRIAYVSGPDIGNVGGGDPARQGTAQRRIWVMDADGSNKRQLTDDPAYRDERPLWSRDGSQILFVRIDNAEDVASLWIVAVNGGSPTKVADLSFGRPPTDPPLWFGFYGYVAWDRYFAWWQES